MYSNLRAEERFQPYYLVQAFSRRANKQQTQFVPREMNKGHRLSSLKEAKRRSIEYARSLNEASSMGYADWQPIVRIVSEQGNYIVQ